MAKSVRTLEKECVEMVHVLIPVPRAVYDLMSDTARPYKGHEENCSAPINLTSTIAYSFDHVGP